MNNEQSDNHGLETHLISRSAPLADRLRHYARRIQIHADLVASQNPGIPVYLDWSRVPRSLKTKGQWDDRNRRVVPRAMPAGIVIWADVIEVRDDQRRPLGMNDVRCKSIRLFAESQTTSFTPTKLELAHRTFFNIYVRPCSRERYCFWSEKDGHWKCCWSALTKQHVRSHINGTGIYGVYGGDCSRFMAIDLDLHAGDPDVFLTQLTILLAELGGQDGWHLQVADENAGGVHFLRVVAKASLDRLRDELRACLQTFDSKYPEQAIRAEAAGMKSLGSVEIFPDPQRVFRLPLCRGRTMLLDHTLPLVANRRARNGVVQDVEAYVRWLAAVNDAESRATTP